MAAGTCNTGAHINPFTHITRRGLKIPSRVILAPINTGFASNGTPTDRLLQFHSLRASHAVGVSFLGNVAVHEHGLPNPHTAILRASTDLAPFGALADCMWARGSVPGIQLAHSLGALAPRRAWQAPDASAELARLRDLVVSISAVDIATALTRFQTSVRLASVAGFQVIQLHAAHGYLLSLLLSPRVNVRVDSFRFDAQWLEDLIQNAIAAAGPALLSVRISALLGLASAQEEADDAAVLVDRLTAAGVDIIDLSAGLYTLDRRLIYPNHRWNAPVYLDVLPRIVSQTGALVIIGGRLTDIPAAARLLSDNVLLAFGRAFIADHGFAVKSMEGRDSEITRCALTNRCHYFSRGRQHLECGVNTHL